MNGQLWKTKYALAVFYIGVDMVKQLNFDDNQNPIAHQKTKTKYFLHNNYCNK